MDAHVNMGERQTDPTLGREEPRLLFLRNVKQSLLLGGKVEEKIYLSEKKNAHFPIYEPKQETITHFKNMARIL